MTTDVQVYEQQAVALYSQTDSWVAVLGDVGDLASKIAATEFVPDTMRGRPAAVAACILSGRELNIGPMTSLAHIHIVKGKPGMSAQLMRALILSAGHELEFRETTSTRCVVAGRRRGSEAWTTAQFTADDAKKASINLGGYPEDKLVARATARLARRIFADCLGGMPYLAEELEDGAVAEPATAASSAPRRRTAQRATRATTVTAERVDAPPAPEPVFDEPPLDDEPTAEPEPVDEDAVTPAQIKMLAATMGQAGMTDRADALAYVASVIGREVASRNDLTRAEASSVIDALLHDGDDVTDAEVVAE